MNILEELTSLFNSLNIPTETGVFKNKAPDTYIVFTPLSDELTLHSDNKPEREVQEVRLSLYTKGNYVGLVKRITKTLLDDEFTITDRRYIGHENDTGYHHYAIDVAKDYEF